MSATILLSVLAASLTVPQPGKTFSSAALAPRDGSGVAIVELFIAPDRKVEDCKILGSQFSERENDRVCASLRGKRAAKAAAGPDGQAAYGALTYIVADSEEGGVPLESALPADVVLDVASLPGGSRKLRVNVLLNTSGDIVQCEAAPGDAGAFADAACKELKAQRLPVRKGSDGTPVSYVDELSIEFVQRQAGL